MDRAERKRRNREIEAWTARQTFVQVEIIRGNYLAYEIGVGHALDAAAALFGIGPTRVERFQEKLHTIQRADGIGENITHKPEMAASSAAFDATYVFPRKAAQLMNIESYKVALDHIRDAVAIIYGLGAKRMKEYESVLAGFQERDDLTTFMQDGNAHRLGLARALRREAEPRKASHDAVDSLVTP
ncbi:hypothetical protein [Paenibacillus sp. FSL R5-0908]|uniref:hypothetical protein n=1 Tax=Paenibacillus sp. FSL R5-0908 TaxID=2921664 RepID=UPI0030FC4F6C